MSLCSLCFLKIQNNLSKGKDPKDLYYYFHLFETTTWLRPQGQLPEDGTQSGKIFSVRYELRWLKNMPAAYL